MIRTNLITNPSFETGVAGITASYVGTGVTVSSLTQASDITAPYGTYHMAVAFSGGGAAGGVDVILRVANSPVTTGYSYVFTYACYSTTGVSFMAGFDWLDSTQTQLSTNGSTNGSFFTPASQWTRISTVGTAPTGTSYARPTIWILNGTSGSATTARVDGMLLENLATMRGTYFDGTTTGAAWTGTAHASTSTMTLPNPGTGLLPMFGN